MIAGIKSTDEGVKSLDLVLIAIENFCCTVADDAAVGGAPVAGLLPISDDVGIGRLQLEADLGIFFQDIDFSAVLSALYDDGAVMINKIQWNDEGFPVVYHGQMTDKGVLENLLDGILIRDFPIFSSHDFTPAFSCNKG